MALLLKRYPCLKFSSKDERMDDEVNLLVVVVGFVPSFLVLSAIAVNSFLFLCFCVANCKCLVAVILLLCVLNSFNC